FDAVSVGVPSAVQAGQEFDVPITLSGAGDLIGLSVTLHWDASVVTPVDATVGELVASQGGVMFSPAAGQVDAALLGAGQGMVGEGTVAVVRFRAVTSGVPNVEVGGVIGRDGANQAVAVKVSAPLAVIPVATTTRL